MTPLTRITFDVFGKTDGRPCTGQAWATRTGFLLRCLLLEPCAQP